MSKFYCYTLVRSIFFSCFSEYQTVRVVQNDSILLFFLVSTSGLFVWCFFFCGDAVLGG